VLGLIEFTGRICKLVNFVSDLSVEILKRLCWFETLLHTAIPRFTSLSRSSKTARKAKTRKMKIHFPLLPDGNNDLFARGRSSHKRRMARKLKNKDNLCISYK
jgi:hypothetical protein